MNEASDSSATHSIAMIDEPEQRIVKGFVHRGQAFVANETAMEAVTLCATPSRLLFLQLPRRFQADGNARAEKALSDVKKQNQEYEFNCKFNRDHPNQADLQTQTVEEAFFHKATSTQLVQLVDKQIEANYVDIVQKDTGGAQDTQIENQDVKFKEASQKGDTDIDDDGSVYTGKDEVSETGTQHTAKTTNTATQSVGSVGSSIHEQDKARQDKISSLSQKIYQNKKFLMDLHLAELLALQGPMHKVLQLYRAVDIQLSPEIDYKELVRSEFRTTNPHPKLNAHLLFTYKSEKISDMKVTALDFCPTDERLLAVGYSANNYGAIAVWQPENPFAPKVLVFTRQELTALKWFPQGKSIVAAGFADGSICIFDIREQAQQLDAQGFANPVLQATNKTGKHTSRVWDLQWVGGEVGPSNEQEVELDNLVSVATDGRVVERSLKRNFEQRDILTLTGLAPHPVALVQNQKNSRMTIIRKLSAGLSIDFIDQTTYLVSGDDALVRRASRSYSEQTLQQYAGHLSSVYRVRVCANAPKYFLTASADRTCRVWDVEKSEALVVLRTIAEEHVYAAEWCPFRASVFACGSRNGTVELWDLMETTVQPQICLKKLNDAEVKAKPDEPLIPVRAICFNQKVPVFAVGYENRFVKVYRLNGVENGFILKQIDLEGFMQVEGERMDAVLNQQAK